MYVYNVYMYDYYSMYKCLLMYSQSLMCCTDFHCRYDERIDRVETRIAARLRDQLGTAKSANEMFRIFSRYNALFVRSHIRGAIREYQTQLIQRVKDDIESLHNKFKVSVLRLERKRWEGREGEGQRWIRVSVEVRKRFTQCISYGRTASTVAY